ncbi:MAG: YggT family protein [Candidatus Cloacimonetes bacterium]|nr:YggT family protein [Candidatus Cloacimonadota bacterium]
MGNIGMIVWQLLEVYKWIVIARAVISWFSPNYNNQFWRFLVEITEPPLGFIRGYLQKIFPSIIDFSPIILILLIVLVQNLVSGIVFFRSV